MGFGDVGDLETTDAVGAVPVDGPEVEDVLDVFDRVDVAIDIDIVVVGVDGADERGIVGHLYTTALVDGTLLVFDNPVVDGAVVDGEDVGGLARLCVDHRPDGTAVAIHFTILADNAEVTGGEVAHGRFHPRLDIELGVLYRHLVHLDGEAREHPRAVDSQQIFHAEATSRGVKVGGVEHVVAEMAHEEVLREVAVEGIGEKVVRSYLIHFFFPLLM